VTSGALKARIRNKLTKNGSPALDRSFWTSPRNTSLRRWSFYIHFYAGLIAGLLFSVVGVTGSILVFVPELRVLEVPGHAEVRPTTERLPFETLFQVVRKSRPNDFIESFSSASERASFELAPNKALNFRSYSPTQERIQTFIDPYTGKIICQYNYDHRFLQKIYDLHDNLLGGLTGRLINAWFAMLLLGVSFAGLLLWWRGRKYWRLGLEYRIQASWKRQTWDIHNLGGFLFFLPLLILAVTGIYYSFESQFAKAAGVLTHSPTSIRTPRSSVAGAKWRPIDDILRSSDQAAPDCKPTIFYFPKSADASFYVRVRCPYDPHAVGLTYIYVDPSTARTTLVDRFYQEPSGMRIIRLMTPIHYGDVGGLPTRILWIVVGLTPGILFATSLLMWWNRSLSKKWSRHSLKYRCEENLSTEQKGA
jgi:uncharacterized iron-regulated membrane protein